MRPLFLPLLLLAAPLAVGAPFSATDLVGKSPAAARKALGKPVKSRQTSDVVEEWYRVPSAEVFRISHRAGRIFNVWIQSQAKNLTPTQALGRFGIKVKGDGTPKKLTAVTTLWGWDMPKGSPVSRVFLRRSGIEQYHYDLLERKLPKDTIVYTFILSGPGGPRPAGMNMGLG